MLRTTTSRLSTLLLIASAGLAQGADMPSVSDDAQVVPGRMLIGFRGTMDATAKAIELATMGGSSAAELDRTGIHVVSIEDHDPIATATSSGKRRNISLAQPDYVYHPEWTPDDTEYAKQWHLNKIQAPAAWDNTKGSSNVLIAILDTGVDGTHPDLKNRLVSGWNFYSNNSDTKDVYGHGTATAGTAAAEMNNSAGVASVAGGCKIMPIRISDANGYAYSSTTANALRWARDHGARVANLSFGFGGDSTVLSAAGYFRDGGGVVTISAGNDGKTYAYANDPRALVISATDSNDTITSWSSRGKFVDLAAPGLSVFVTRRVADGSYAYWSGTSFSAPIVAGVAALVISAKPELTASQVEDALKKSATDRGASGYDTNYGYGRVNAAAAVGYALGTWTPPTPPTITGQPSSVSVVKKFPTVFSVSAVANGTLAYQWQRAAPKSTTFSSISGATLPVYVKTTTPTTENGAKFRCIVTNSVSGLSVTSNAASLVVRAK